MSVLIPPATLLCTLMMMFLSISSYKIDNYFTWVNILLVIGAGLTAISYFMMVLKNKQAYYLQLLGTLFSLVFIIPLFFRTFSALVSGQKIFLYSFLTMCIILILQLIISMNSYKNIEKSTKES
jgi:hypothetical protein